MISHFYFSIGLHKWLTFIIKDVGFVRGHKAARCEEVLFPSDTKYTMSLQILIVPWKLWRDFKPNLRREEKPPHRRSSPCSRRSCRAPCSIIYSAYSKLSGSPRQRYSVSMTVWVLAVYWMVGKEPELFPKYWMQEPNWMTNQLT